MAGQAQLAQALIEGGTKKEGILILLRLEGKAKRRHVSPVDLASVYTVLGDHEKALTLLESAEKVGLGFNLPMPKPVLFGLRGLQNEENGVAATRHLTPICRGK